MLVQEVEAEAKTAVLVDGNQTLEVEICEMQGLDVVNRFELVRIEGK